MEVKVDIVNDLASHYGDFEYHEALDKIDSWRNILSNKLSAIFRYEAKDYVDIWMISKKGFSIGKKSFKRQKQRRQESTRS